VIVILAGGATMLYCTLPTNFQLWLDSIHGEVAKSPAYVYIVRYSTQLNSGKLLRTNSDCSWQGGLCAACAFLQACRHTPCVLPSAVLHSATGAFGTTTSQHPNHAVTIRHTNYNKL
jgi:hypothetical protein